MKKPRWLPAYRLVFVLVLLMVTTVAVYWVGLSGPFLFDDRPNFVPVQAWLEGNLPLERVLFGNTSLLTHRSLAMGSFALNAWGLGYSAWSFKLVNLLLHLTCGVVAYQLFRQILLRDERMTTAADGAALVVVGVWLLHPLNVSTVLYAVQRMTQLSALCCLLGLLIYTTVRNRQILSGTTRGSWAIFLGVPLLTFLGIQAKQNAAILPALCLLVEIAFFAGPRQWSRPITAFFSLSLFLPIMLSALLLLVHPDALLRDYTEYPFTLSQRLLSEARVVCSYLFGILLPYSPDMGLYTDDVTISTSLLLPWTTLTSLMFLSVASWAAWKLKERNKLVFFGWFFFLTGHIIEGTIIPIELYYEHRNYLPSFGIIAAALGLAQSAGSFLRRYGIRTERISLLAAGGILATLALLTGGRANVWSDYSTIISSAWEAHPNSARATFNYTLFLADAGQYSDAKAILDTTIASDAPEKLKAQLRLFSVLLECRIKHESSAEALFSAVEALPPHIELSTLQLFQHSFYLVEKGECRGISRTQFAEAIGSTLDRARAQTDNSPPKWMLRHHAARLYAMDGDWRRALEQASLSWQPSSNAAVAQFLVQALLMNGRIEEAEKVYAEARSRADLRLSEDLTGLKSLREMIARAKNGMPPEHATAPDKTEP